MAGGMDLGSGGKGGKKALDTTINLVPFIDLMAVTIVFLIMTAVWTQLGRLQVSQSGQNPDPDPVPPTTQPISLLVTEREMKLTVGGSSLDAIAITRTDRGALITEGLAKKLRELKGQQPDQSAITLNAEDTVKYDDLVRLIDAMVQDDQGTLFPSVSVAGVGT
ncbi:MAG: biopolymer transporter ExbD [Archangium sp.]|nr:biopolymer transporter ExbD [Archangium sp.]